LPIDWLAMVMVRRACEFVVLIVCQNRLSWFGVLVLRQANGGFQK
jgi:hypothetical protein